MTDDALIDLAHRLADAAAAVTRHWFRRRPDVVQKADFSPVTAADRGAEAAIGRLLAEERPDDGMIGEEFGARNADAAHVWVIDPIDGTKAFITGKPTFGTLIALLEDGRPVLGVIDQPIVGDRWIGAAGRPTLLNGAPATTRPCPADLDGAMLAATAPDMFDTPDLAAAFARVSGRCAATTWGGDCYAYGLLAAGFLDLVIEAHLKLYDYAALVPVIEGAGGVMTDWAGAPLGPSSDGRVIAAGDATAHAAARRLLEG
ncbi:MAG: histidinol-phosphatase [Deinococcus-Thermus bacterium]|jgi:histidinol phosphatase-like enzyme (inositol monophosphatase family)|nr:histidinol-phosphatase [Deinococcota bacterium]